LLRWDVKEDIPITSKINCPILKVFGSVKCNCPFQGRVIYWVLVIEALVLGTEKKTVRWITKLSHKFSGCSMTKFGKCTKLFSINKVVSKIIYTFDSEISFTYLNRKIKCKINKRNNLGGVCKIYLIVQSLVTWFDCRILAAVTMIWIPFISLLN